MKKMNANNEIVKNNNGVYEVKITDNSDLPVPAKKPLVTTENAKKFAKDVCYCAGISLASTLLLQGGSALVNKVRSKISSKKGDDKK